jgi:hypothetical protein
MSMRPCLPGPVRPLSLNTTDELDANRHTTGSLVDRAAGVLRYAGETAAEVGRLLLHVTVSKLLAGPCGVVVSCLMGSPFGRDETIDG